jgi:hypothetical protein
MSDHAHHDAAPATTDAALFSPAEIEQFGADDVEAGGAIGKMLSALFFYTVIAMGIAGWWTWSSINARTADAGETADSAHDAGHDTHAH